MASHFDPCSLALLAFVTACNRNTPEPITDAATAHSDAGSVADAAVARDASVPRDAGFPLDASRGRDSGSWNPDAGADAGLPSYDPNDHFDGTSRLTGLPEVECTIRVTSAEVSGAIPTVGIVTFTSTLEELRVAEIHFGRDADYGLVAPVMLDGEENRTLLLGMVQARTHHYRVAVSDGISVCYGEDETLETGTLNVAPLEEAWTSALAAPGFIVTGHDGKAVVYAKDGEPVWAYPMYGLFSVGLSWDGQYMIGRDVGPFDRGSGGLFYRVRMDGSDFVTLDAPGGDHHDFAAIPGGIAYLAKTNEGECDKVYEASNELTDGTPIFDTWEIYQYFPTVGETRGTELCHANRIHYLLDEDVYTVSDRNKDALAIFGGDGTPIRSIGRPPMGEWAQHVLAESAGPGREWHIQHGHHLYADDKLIVFSNESTGGAAVVHYTLSGNRASFDWKYAGAGASPIQGDVQRLPNGNFLVTTNLDGTIAEINADGRQEVGRYVLAGSRAPLYGFTYSTHRPSLYGAPAPR